MRWLNVFFAQLVYAILENAYVIESNVLNDTSSDDSTTKLEFINKLFHQLLEQIAARKQKLEDPALWPKDFGAEYLKGNNMTFDYIIVGAGTAGSVVASRLSENPNVTVLVLEAGGDPPIHSEIYPISMILFNTPYTWNDYGEPSPTCCRAMQNERCYWPRGRMIGGTGSLNGNVFATGTSGDFDEWEAQGNDGWDWANINPLYFKATRKMGSKISRVGSLTLNSFQRMKNFDILKDLMVYGTKEMEGSLETKSSGYNENIQATLERGIRMSTAKTYLGRVSSTRPNLHVIKNSVVTQVLFESEQKATGVKFILNGTHELKAITNREVIISAGTFNSPKLLMLSGVGPRDDLANFNITLVQDSPVGGNLQDHGMMPLVMKFNKNIPDVSEDITPHNLYQYLMFQKGPLASNPTLVGFIRTLETLPQNISDIMLIAHFSKPTLYSNSFTFLQFKEDFVRKFLQKVENQTLLQLMGLIIKPKSRGSIKLKSKDPMEGPLIYNNLGSSTEDQQTLLRFIRFVQKLLNTVMFQYYGLELLTIPIEECDKFKYDSNDYWLCYIKYFYISAWHAAGTCHMGPPTDSAAVLDSHLRVYGTKSLRVIDASIMPNITSANTNGPTILIAERGAELIKNDWENSIREDSITHHIELM